MVNAVARLERALKAAGLAVVGVSPVAGGGWKVWPDALQPAAQPIIDAFDPNAPAHETAEREAEVVVHLDQERIFSAIVWAILDTYSAPATVTKYAAARNKIIQAYKGRPWVP